MKTTIRAITLTTASLLLAVTTRAQTNLNFNSISASEKGSIRLSWNSTSNEVYQIEYADELTDPNVGPINWQPLYTDYPSHGTNTFIADSGNYDNSPAIVHPKRSPMRFYRIFLVQENDSPTNPVVAVTFPTNGASLSGDVTMVVSANSAEFLSDVKLYVDGEEQWISPDNTNFVINTCEWPNGSHTIFAVAKSQSGLEGVANGGPITYGRKVSSYVIVTFSKSYTENSRGITNVVKVAVVGTSVCQNDKLLDAQEPDGSGLEYNEQTVFTPTP